MKIFYNMIEKREGFKNVYFWGLLGLVPELGAIVGLILVVLGLVKLKDRVLVLIGLGCILFTLTLNYFVYYQIKKNPNLFGGIEQIAEIELNTLVKEIEFFKVQKGRYPYSLNELLENGSMVSIYDPFQFGKNSAKESQFKYNLIGSKYVLFSVGNDKVPNTIDDIYPTVISK